MLDPGIGFGKTVEHNLELLRRLGRARRDRPAGRDRHLAQVVPRAGSPAARSTSAWPATIATNVLALRARRPRLPRPRRRPDARRAARWRLLRSAADEPDDDDEPTTTTSTRTTTRTQAPRPSSRSRSPGLSLYTHHGVSDAEREIGQRLVARPAPRGRRVRRDRHRPRRGHGRLRRGLPDRRARRPAALLPHARAPVRGDRRPPARPTSRPRACGSRRAKPEPPIPLPVEEVSVEVVARARRVSGRAQRASATSGLGSNVGDRRANLAGRGRARCRRHGVACSPRRRPTRPSRWARSSTSPTSSTPACGSRPSSSPRRCSTPARRSSASSAARPAAARHAPAPDRRRRAAARRPRATRPSGCACRTREVTSRRFVLVPLLELDPELRTPDGARATRSTRSPTAARRAPALGAAASALAAVASARSAPCPRCEQVAGRAGRPRSPAARRSRRRCAAPRRARRCASPRRVARRRRRRVLGQDQRLDDVAVDLAARGRGAAAGARPRPRPRARARPPAVGDVRVTLPKPSARRGRRRARR